MLPRKGGAGQIFGRGTGTHGIGFVGSQVVPRRLHSFGYGGGDGQLAQLFPCRFAYLAHLCHIAHGDLLELGVKIIQVGVAGHKDVESGRADAKARWHGEASAGHFAQVGSFAPHAG